MCRALDLTQCMRRREIFLNELQNLFISYYCDKCYAKETPVLRVHKGAGQGRDGGGPGRELWEAGGGPPDHAEELASSHGHAASHYNLF